MNITEIQNTELYISPAKMNLDNRLDKPSDPLPSPLPNTSFSMSIVGSSGSGKTSLMSSIITSKKKDGKRQSYIKLFSKIVICSPTLASFKSNIWGRIKNKYSKFDLQFLNELQEIAEEQWENDGKQTLCIMDDIGATLKRDRKTEMKLVSMLQNRRHMGLSVIILVQKWKDLPSGVRNNLTNVAIFTPKNNMEKEAVFGELLPMKKQLWDSIYDYVYDDTDKYNFLFVDMSLKVSPTYRYYKKFNQLLFD